MKTRARLQSFAISFAAVSTLLTTRLDAVHGPILTVTGNLIDPIVTTNIMTPPTEVTVAMSVSIRFCWTADASPYGGVITGYRYQWDLTDPNDDAQWDMDFTPFPTPSVCSVSTLFQTGSHTFHVEVIDNSGFRSRVPILVRVDAALPVEAVTWGRVKSLYGSRTPGP